jgi:hypothetical protein
MMSRLVQRYASAFCAVAVLTVGSLVNPTPAGADDPPAPDIGVDRADLSAAVSNPYVAFSTLKRAVYVGKERDPETGKAFKVRMEVSPREVPDTLAGISATVVDVTHWTDDEVVEKSRDYYAQHASGVVHYIAEHVDDYEGGKIVGHDGQWTVGEKGSKAGIFMPPALKVGDVFEQERVPGISQNRAKVLSTTRTVKVPAGTFTGCIEIEEYDVIEKATARKWYCPGAGLVKEASVERTIELIERVAR